MNISQPRQLSFFKEMLLNLDRYVSGTLEETRETATRLARHRKCVQNVGGALVWYLEL